MVCVWCVCGGVVLVGVNWTGHARLASGVSGMFAVKHAEGRKKADSKSSVCGNEYMFAPGHGVCDGEYVW